MANKNFVVRNGLEIGPNNVGVGTIFSYNEANNAIGIGTTNTAGYKLSLIGTPNTGTGGFITRSAPSRDGISLTGGSSGTAGYAATISPSTLSANRVITVPDASGEITVNTATQTLTNKTLTAPKIDLISDSGGNELINFASMVGTPVNEITVTNAISGEPPSIASSGGDTNVDFVLSPKGGGVLRLGTGDFLQPSVVTSYGSNDLVLGTGGNGGSIIIKDGTDANITLSSNGTGFIGISSGGLRIVDQSALSFGVLFKSSSSTTLTADRNITFDVKNASRSLTLSGNLSLAANLTTTGGNITLTTPSSTSATLPSGTVTLLASNGSGTSLTFGTGSISLSGNLTHTGGSHSFSSSGSASVTLPLTGTLATLAGTETLTNKTLGSGLAHSSSSTSSDATITVDSNAYSLYSIVASFTTNRTVQVANLSTGKFVTIYLRNTNGTARTITIQASTTTSSFVPVNLSPTTPGNASVSTVTLAATSGTAVVRVFNANGVIGGALT